MALAVIRNYNAFNAPTHFRIADLLKKFDKTFGATGKSYGKVSGDRTMADIAERRADRWNFLFIAGMVLLRLERSGIGRPSRAQPG